MNRSPDWSRIATMPSLVAGGADLEWVDLLQRGLLGSPLALTAEGELAFPGSGDMVVRDQEGTPLLIARRAGDGIETEQVRLVEPEPPFLPASDVALIVAGPLGRAELDLVDAELARGEGAAWLVCADRGARGRALVCEARMARQRWRESTHTLMRVPWPRPCAGDLFTSTLPTPAQLAAAFGIRRHVLLGDCDTPSRGRGGAVVFLTGLSGAGKSTLARALRDRIDSADERPVTLLDGDEVRRRLSPDLGFDEASRAANVRRVSWVASLLAGAGGIAITALIAPFSDLRDEARAMASQAGADFIEVWVATPLGACEERDRKGLYARAREGRLANFTGISSPYEEPERPDVVIDTTRLSPEEGAAMIVNALRGGTGRLP